MIVQGGTMIVLVSGSRNWADYLIFNYFMTEVLNRNIEESYAQIEFYVGDCPTGADALLLKYAGDRGWSANVAIFTADWSKYGKSAGPRRNQEMVDCGLSHAKALGCEVIAITFPMLNSKGTFSKGTLDFTNRCKSANIAVFEVGEVL